MKQLQAIRQAIRYLWHSLPVKVQGGIVVAAAAAASSIGEVLTNPSACLQPGCLRRYVAVAAGAGVVAGRAFFMRPGPGPRPFPHDYTGS